MPYLLNVVYAVLLIVASPWLAWQAYRTGKYRSGWQAKLWGRVPERSSDRFCVWLHAVSVGEVNLLKTLMDEIGRQRPEWECVISTTTVTGYALARQKYADRHVFYAPLDFTWAVNETLDRIHPDLLVLAELELWPNLISAAQSRGIPVAVANGRLSERSFRGYARLKPLLTPVLRKLDLVAAQNPEYAERFLALGAGIDTVHVTGSIKYDGARTNRLNADTQHLARLIHLAPDEKVFLAGSTQAPEESLALETYRKLSKSHPELRLIIVPRHAERFAEVAGILERCGMPFERRSRLDQIPHNKQARILLVDAIGELGSWWGMADVAFVGGSLSTRGGQNMLEPAAYGAAVSFGTDTRNFRDIVQGLLSADAAVVVQDGAEMTGFVARCLEEPGYAAGLGRRARVLVAAGQGATARTVNLLVGLIDGESEAPAPPVRRAA